MDPLRIALITGSFTLAGAFLAVTGVLISQLINTKAAMRAKQLEIIYARKYEAYTRLLDQFLKTSQQPTSANFLAFKLLALQTSMISSPEIKHRLSVSLIHTINRLRLKEGSNDAEINQAIKEWNEVAELMRADLQKLIQDPPKKLLSRLRARLSRRKKQIPS